MHLSLEGKVLKHCKEIVRLCSFGKYPYSHHRRFFFFWFGIKDPSPLEFPVTFHGGGGGIMDIFWNHTLQTNYKD